MNFFPILYFFLRIGKYFLGLALIVGLVLGSIIIFYSLDVKSVPNGSFTHSQLRDKTSIVFDQSDVAHIDARFANDAYFALGYLHGRERTWQMEFNRRLASGTLSEILGEKTVGIDRFIKTLGIRNAAREQYKTLPANTKLALEAYSEGVNAGFNDLGWALPIEFFLTESKPAIWTPIDSVSWIIMLGLDLGDNWNKEFSRLEMSQNLSTDQIWDVMPPYPGDPRANTIDFAKMYKDADIFVKKDPKISLMNQQDDLMAWIPHNMDGKGSNNWVIAGSHTISGKPILANDPHLSLSSPSTWYFAHLKAKDLDVIGGTIPGIPGVTLGHNSNIAWGITNTAPDVQDLYIEAIDPKNPVNYKTPTGYQAFQVRRESILVKGREPINFVVRQTRHGPVISDAFPDAAKVIDTSRFVLAMRWTALDPENQSIRALVEINKASSLEEFKTGLEHYYAPMQNIVMADTQGNIAFQAAGTAPKRMKGEGMLGVAPTFGWMAENDWKTYLRFDELPHRNGADLPWLITANNKVEEDSVPFTLTSDWTYPYRANRISELLGKTKKHSVSSQIEIQNDTLSLAVNPLIALLRQSTSPHPLTQVALQQLQNFDGDMKGNAAAPLIFNAWVDQFTRAVFAPKLGQSFDRIYRQRGLREGLLFVLENHQDEWCDQAQTSAVETCAALSNIALEKALNYLSKRYGNDVSSWQWKEAHIDFGAHKPFGQVPWLAKYFNISTPASGDGQTVNVGKMSFNQLNEPYSADVAPGMRAVYDLSDLDQSIFIAFGGQSGWVQSHRYKEYTDLWAKGNYLPLTMTPKELKPYKIELSPP
jgi:penicillin amidase